MFIITILLLLSAYSIIATSNTTPLFYLLLFIRNILIIYILTNTKVNKYYYLIPAIIISLFLAWIVSLSFESNLITYFIYEMFRISFICYIITKIFSKKHKLKLLDYLTILLMIFIFILGVVTSSYMILSF